MAIGSVTQRRNVTGLSYHSISALRSGQGKSSRVREGLAFTDRVSAALPPEETDMVKDASIPATPNGFPGGPCDTYRLTASKVGQIPFTFCLRPVAKALRELPGEAGNQCVMVLFATRTSTHAAWRWRNSRSHHWAIQPESA